MLMLACDFSDHTSMLSTVRVFILSEIHIPDIKSANSIGNHTAYFVYIIIYWLIYSECWFPLTAL